MRRGKRQREVNFVHPCNKSNCSNSHSNNSNTYTGRGNSQLSQFPAAQPWGIRRMWWTWWRHICCVLHNICICNEGGHGGSSESESESESEPESKSESESATVTVAVSQLSKQWQICISIWKYSGIFVYFLFKVFFRISYALNGSTFGWRRVFSLVSRDPYLAVSLVSKATGSDEFQTHRPRIVRTARAEQSVRRMKIIQI